MTQKNLINFVMMGGLPGSGKSTVAQKTKTTFPYKEAVVVSSDSIRKELYGDEAIQGDNASLFNEIHKRIIGLLLNGESVIFDATNLSRKHRIAFLQKIKNIPDVEKTYWLVATSFTNCVARNEKRSRNVPYHVMKRMRESFNVPLYSEGWDRISILFDYDESEYDIGAFLEKMKTYNQDSKYHTHTLGDHLRAVQLAAIEKMPNEPILSCAALLHDCGKPHTKTFENKNGLLKESASYYGHEYVGAYESLFYMDRFFTSTRKLLDAAALIEFHMMPYFATTEKAKQKIKDLLGEDLYYMLELLHEADKESH